MKWSKQVVVTVGAVVIRECGVGSNLGVGGSWECQWGVRGDVSREWCELCV